MKLITIVLCLLCPLLIAPVGGGQNARPAPKCPQLVIACPLETVEQNTQLRFSALVAGDDQGAALSYSWSLSSGRVSEGQGTPSIIVDTTGMGGRRITAKVVVGGLGPGCQSTVSCAILVMKSSEIVSRPTPERVERPAAPTSEQQQTGRVVNSRESSVKPTAPASKPTEVVRKPLDVPRVDSSTARRLDNYGELSFEAEKDHLAGFARELRRAPDAQGYIIVYGGRCGAVAAALERAERAKEWLINKHGIDASRIVAIDGGYRENQATEIFIGPVDATWPELKASVQPLDDAPCK